MWSVISGLTFAAVRSEFPTPGYFRVPTCVCQTVTGHASLIATGADISND
jgi:hypothetical protein